MKRILISLALSVVCLAVTIGSFLTNDIAAYRDWAMTNHPKMVDKFDRHFPGFRETIPGQGPNAPIPPDQRKNPFNNMNPPRDGNPPPAERGPRQGKGPIMTKTT